MNMGFKKAAFAVISAAAVSAAALGSTGIANADPYGPGDQGGYNNQGGYNGPDWRRGQDNGYGHHRHDYRPQGGRFGNNWDGPGYHGIRDFEVRYPGDSIPQWYVPFNLPWGPLVFVPGPPNGMYVTFAFGTIYWVFPGANAGC